MAETCARMVVGGRGNYLEFEPHQIIQSSIYIPDDQKWRLIEK